MDNREADHYAGISADLPACRGCHVTHEQIAVIGVTVKVVYRPGLHPSWKTSVRFDRKFVKHHAGASGSTSGDGTKFRRQRQHERRQQLLGQLLAPHPPQLLTF